ncbi:MAG: O-antigen ligase family protein [Prevotellaceae bacterium]|jgi:O-antigen ligase|nr:O-antigen ligase family protein [Prevotellaceae bacterium]
MKSGKPIKLINPVTCITILGIVCFCALFVSSRMLVNPQVTPKWMGVALCAGVAGIVAAVARKGRGATGRPAAWWLCVVLCVVVLLRTWMTDGLSFRLLPPVLCLLLWILATKVTERAGFKYIAGTLALFGVALALHGILQYTGVLFPGNGNFPVTGSFDNPAGFAAALACTLPLCFLFFENSFPHVKYIAVAAALLIAAALVLSGSRAGMVSIVSAGLAYAFVRLRIISRKLKTIIAVALVTLCAAFYLFKKDSADGRLLIWRCTWDMVADKPVFGHGQGAFQAEYMCYQADYFNAHPDSRYADLADNVLHPFNEYLRLLAEHGRVGLACVILLGGLLWRRFARERTPEKTAALLCLLSLSVFACFSYPFTYPFTWVVAFLSMAVVCGGNEITLCRTAVVVRAFMATLSVCVLCAAVLLLWAEKTWNDIARQSLAGKTREVLPEYDKLYRYLGHNGLFLYNHAAELHEAGEYEQSIAAFERCMHYYNDMDVQMLLADNCRKLHGYEEAERHLKTAAAMCPVRFIPLYKLAKLYDAAGRHDDALAVAQQIVNKEIKIPSHTIAAIKNEMRRLIEREENDQPNHDLTRQGEAPEATPRGGALPP